MSSFRSSCLTGESVCLPVPPASSRPRGISPTPVQHHWRWNRLAQLVAHEHRQLGSGCQPADIAVEVETVEALHFQRDVPIKEFRDGCQFPDFTTKLGS